MNFAKWQFVTFVHRAWFTMKIGIRQWFKMNTKVFKNVLEDTSGWISELLMPVEWWSYKSYIELWRVISVEIVNVANVLPYMRCAPVHKSLARKWKGKNTTETWLVRQTFATEIRFFRSFGTQRMLGKVNVREEECKLVWPACEIVMCVKCIGF